VPDGIILVDKPAGVTSHDVVAGQRRRLPRGTKVGHAGTLDPFATGLLLILLGRATRVQRYLMALEKRYEVVARFGARSDTGDRDGVITETGRLPEGDLPLPTGRLRQRPPAYSAIKVGGRRAYELARAGVAVEVPERTVDVYAFDELWRSAERRAYRIRCGSGTYVRSLVMDLGDAYCEELRRTAIGPFEVAAADPEVLIDLPDALAFLPGVTLDPALASRAAHGQPVPASPGAGAAAAAAVRLLGPDGLIAVAEPRPDGTLKPVVGFRG
jgi:tRNA pseudouridine55 synthase